MGWGRCFKIVVKALISAPWAFLFLRLLLASPGIRPQMGVGPERGLLSPRRGSPGNPRRALPGPGLEGNRPPPGEEQENLPSPPGGGRGRAPGGGQPPRGAKKSSRWGNRTIRNNPPGGHFSPPGVKNPCSLGLFFFKKNFFLPICLFGLSLPLMSCVPPLPKPRNQAKSGGEQAIAGPSGKTGPSSREPFGKRPGPKTKNFGGARTPKEKPFWEGPPQKNPSGGKPPNPPKAITSWRPQKPGVA